MIVMITITSIIMVHMFYDTLSKLKIPQAFKKFRNKSGTSKKLRENWLNIDFYGSNFTVSF